LKLAGGYNNFVDKISSKNLGQDDLVLFPVVLSPNGKRPLFLDLGMKYEINKNIAIGISGNLLISGENPIYQRKPSSTERSSSANILADILKIDGQKYSIKFESSNSSGTLIPTLTQSQVKEFAYKMLNSTLGINSTSIVTEISKITDKTVNNEINLQIEPSTLVAKLFFNVISFNNISFDVGVGTGLSKIKIKKTVTESESSKYKYLITTQDGQKFENSKEYYTQTFEPTTTTSESVSNNMAFTADAMLNHSITDNMGVGLYYQFIRYGAHEYCPDAVFQSHNIGVGIVLRF
jgi:hypothetical protein